LSEGLNLSFLHSNSIIIMPVIDNIPPFQRALKSVSTKDDIIVVPGRCIQTITHSNRSGKGCPSVWVPLCCSFCQCLSPPQPQKASARKGFALDTTQV
jgi:hypothetical protein